MTDELKGLIAKAATGATLSREEAARGFDTMMSGEATPSQMGALLMALMNSPFSGMLLGGGEEKPAEPDPDK